MMDALLTVQHTSHFFPCVFQLVDPSVSSDFSSDTTASPANEMSPSLLIFTPDFQLDAAPPSSKFSGINQTDRVSNVPNNLSSDFPLVATPTSLKFYGINRFIYFFLGFLACCFSQPHF
jgi:hypothetical protein